MIPACIWTAGVAGLAAALAQLVLPRRVDLAPLILGSMAVLALLGILGAGWNWAQVMEAHALAHPDLAAATAREAAAVTQLLAASGLALAVGTLGGIALAVRAFVVRRAPAPAPAAAPSTGPAAS